NLYPQYDKILYIDCDVVVRGDISQLYNIDIADNLVGAATDEFVINEPYVHQYVNEVLGFKNLKDYFNAGVLLINLDQFRKQKFEEQFSDLLNKYKFIVQDQDYLNIICRNKVKYIDSSWDKMPCNQDARLEDINLIHFNLIWKPWHTEVPYGEEFWKYADKTEFKDEIRNIRANYTKEQYQKDVDHYNFFMGKIHYEYYNPNNYFHLFLEKKG
ncbi:MAG: glycosyltransferase family 8 protein, partial [Clostridia bacterium]|nr:glycosyltransferase family 8 protein [Clostridia bacterium]